MPSLYFLNNSTDIIWQEKMKYLKKIFNKNKLTKFTSNKLLKDYRKSKNYYERENEFVEHFKTIIS